MRLKMHRASLIPGGVQCKEIFTCFLSVILIISPINAAMSGDFMSHSESEQTSISADSAEIKNTSHHMHDMSNTIDHQLHNQENTTDTEKCPSECANCVYCSASNVTNNDSSLIFYTSLTPEFSKYFSKSNSSWLWKQQWF